MQSQNLMVEACGRRTTLITGQDKISEQNNGTSSTMSHIAPYYRNGFEFDHRSHEPAEDDWFIHLRPSHNILDRSKLCAWHVCGREMMVNRI